MGRATKPTAYVEAEASLPAVSLNSGKKSAGKMSAAAVPYRKKSYHSMAVPIKLATATWRIEDVCPSYSPPNLSTRSSFACPSPIWISDLQPPLCAEYYSSPATPRNPRLRASRLLHRQRLSSLLFLARGARCHGASDLGRPGSAQTLRRLLLALPGRQQEPQPALVHFGSLRNAREGAPLRRKTRCQAQLSAGLGRVNPS